VDEQKVRIEDLEELREVNEELEENHLMTEREIREEMEFKESLIREQMKRIQTAEETNLDYESTIMRFRELVLSLQRYNLYLDGADGSDVETLRQERQSSEAEAKNLSSRSREMMDLNLKLQATSTKSLAKAIDFELRKEHAIEAEEQLNIVKVPPPFTTD
jgi:dynactin 1